MRTLLRNGLEYGWKAPLGMAAYMAGTIMAGILLPALGLQPPAIPGALSPGAVLGLLALAAVLLAASLGPVARGLAGGFAARWAALAGLTFICLGLNVAIEAAIFTRYGGTAALLVMAVPACGLLATATALLFRPAGRSAPGSPDAPASGASCAAQWRHFWAARRPGQWAGRLGLALLAWPVIYCVFGMPVGSLVQEQYRAGAFGLVLPPLSVVLATQFGRGALFLLAVLPVVAGWTGSKRRLLVALAWAFLVMTGLFAMIQAHWLSATLRAIHGVELTADAVTYTAVVVALLAVTPAPVAVRERETALVG